MHLEIYVPFIGHKIYVLKYITFKWTFSTECPFFFSNFAIQSERRLQKKKLLLF